MQEVELALCDARISVLPSSGQDLLCVFDVWPKKNDARSAQRRQARTKSGLAVMQEVKLDVSFVLIEEQ